MTADAPAVPAPASRAPADFTVRRFHVDLTARSVRFEEARCTDVEDVLGGAARGFRLLAEAPVDDAYDAGARLIMNVGLLTGSALMTGLRTFFHAYSPLKVGASRKPGAMWSAGSGKVGTKLRHLGVDEVVFTGRAGAPTLLRLSRDDSADGGVAVSFEEGADLVGETVNGKIQALHGRFPEAHFAVIGPAGEAWRDVRYASIGLSTENQLKSGDAKTRFCGRGGMGGVMGSKNLLAIAVDVPDPRPTPLPAGVREINREVARGKGSARFREAKTGGGGGTWANVRALNEVHALPETNFVPTGTTASHALWRENVEAGPFVVRDESCTRCGIRCHKNVHDEAPDGSAGRFRAKLDYEPLNLLSSNLGIYDPDQACTLVELVDELGMDSISCGASVSYAMEHNRRHPDAPIAGGVAYGDFDATRRTIEEIGRGRLPLLGQGSKRASEELGETGYAMHCKGIELPAYLPHTNPGYPFALAGGHMSMRTYLLLLYERETGLDYWVEAITDRGFLMIRDDLTGACKFAGLSDALMVDAIRACTGLDLDVDGLQRAVRRTHLRGYRIEKSQGFTEDDYVLPDEAHVHHEQIELPYFVTEEFFAELRTRVLARFDAMVEDEGL